MSPSDDNVAAAGAQRDIRLSAEAARWAALTVLAVPLAILAHELGHYLAARGVGFAGVRLHYAGVSYCGMEAHWQAGGVGLRAARSWRTLLVVAAGPLATWLIVAGGAFLARRGHALATAVSLVALSRPLTLSLAALQGALPAAQDESRLALITGVPAGLLLSVSLVGCVLLGAPALRHVACPNRVLGVGCGYLLGRILYEGYVGPWALP